jgi:hypothetical protein
MSPERADSRRFWAGKTFTESHKAAIREGQKLAHDRRKHAEDLARIEAAAQRLSQTQPRKF